MWTVYRKICPAFKQSVILLFKPKLAQHLKLSWKFDRLTLRPQEVHRIALKLLSTKKHINHKAPSKGASVLRVNI